MQKIFQTVVLALVCLVLSINVSAAQYTAGKNYRVITQRGLPQNDTPKNKVVITEFFSYGCPGCNALEKEFKHWTKQHASQIVVRRVPVTFHRNWDILARAYHIANALEVENKVSPALFKAIHKLDARLTSYAAMRQFFVEQGINGNKFDNAYRYAPQIDAAMKQDEKTRQLYQVTTIPAIVVNGKYLVDLTMVSGANKTSEKDYFKAMMNVVDYLTKVERKPNG